MSTFISNEWLRRVDRHWQATNAVICGDVTLGADCSIWFGAVIRGDVAPIALGRAVNVQDGAVLHCDTGEPLIIGDQVSIGHGAVVHCKLIGEGTLIGIKAVLLGGAVIGKNCIVAAGAVVSPGTEVPDGQVVMGVPAKMVRLVRPAELKRLRANNRLYVDLAAEHAAHPEKFYRRRAEKRHDSPARKQPGE